MNTAKPFATVIDAITGETTTRELTEQEIAAMSITRDTDIPTDETPSPA